MSDTAREFGTVIVGQANLRSRVGDDDADILYPAIEAGARLEVLQRYPGERVDWLRVRTLNGRVGWIAEINRDTGERFVRVETVPPVKPPPRSEPTPSKPLQPTFFWQVLALCGLVFAVLIALAQCVG